MFSLTLALALVSSAASVSANCIHGTSFHRREVNGEGKVEVSKFGYSDEQGPLNWAGLDPANSACATSKVQSPIVIDDSIQKAKEAPKCDFPTVEEAEFENLGTTLETVVSGTTNFGGKDFKLQQFHLHTPSEHRIKDEYYPLEMHMVHEAEDKSIAVIAIPFQLTEDGSTTELLTNVIQNIDSVKEPGSVTKTGKLDFKELVDAVQTKPLFQYTGSLTTPPCAEGLTFLVMEEPMKINVKTYNSLKSVIKFNARYTQNKLDKTNLIQVGSQKAELNCAAVEGGENKSAAVELQTGEKKEANVEEINKAEEEMKKGAEEKKAEGAKMEEEAKKMEGENKPEEANKQKEEAAKKYEEAKKKEEVANKYEEAKKCEEEAKQKESENKMEEAKAKHEEAKQKYAEAMKMHEENKKAEGGEQQNNGEEEKKKQEEEKKKQEEEKKNQEEANKGGESEAPKKAEQMKEEAKKAEEEGKKCDEEAKKMQGENKMEEAKAKQEEAKKKYEEANAKKEEVKKMAEGHRQQASKMEEEGKKMDSENRQEEGKKMHEQSAKMMEEAKKMEEPKARRHASRMVRRRSSSIV